MRALVLSVLLTCAVAAEPLVIAAADMAGGGIGELATLMKKLEKAENITDHFYPWCPEAFSGILEGRPVILLYTGIGFKDAGLCLQNFLGKRPTTDRVLYIGTAGFSPQVGGVMRAPSCEAAAPRSELIPIGSVCIGSGGTVWDAHEEPWWTPESVANDSCTNLGDVTHSTRKTYVLAHATQIGPTDFADSVYRVARGMELPTPEVVATSGEKRFFHAMDAGTGVNYTLAAGVPKPTVINRCFENAGYAFWRGAPFEGQCRLYAAEPFNGSPSEAICVSAMEAPGWIDSINRVNAERHAARRAVAAGDRRAAVVATAALPTVVFANVRGNSDFVHWPLYQPSKRAELLARFPNLCAAPADRDAVEAAIFGDARGPVPAAVEQNLRTAARRTAALRASLAAFCASGTDAAASNPFAWAELDPTVWLPGTVYSDYVSSGFRSAISSVSDVAIAVVKAGL